MAMFEHSTGNGVTPPFSLRRAGNLSVAPCGRIPAATPVATFG
jgi:hypothetical protein